MEADVLVLGGGGILGEAWMSAVLAGLDEAAGFDARRCAGYVGTSAGSIVAAALAAGVHPRARLGRLPEQPAMPASETQNERSAVAQALQLTGALGGAAAAPLASLTLRSTAPGGALLRRAALRRVPAGRRSLAELRRAMERLGARWDGRLRIAAVELESGRRVILDGTGTPAPSVAEAVEASCAIPGVFRPVVVDGRSYVDGGAWSPTNMDAADVSRGSRVLCLNPTGTLSATTGSPLGAMGPVSRSLAAVEALALRQRGARVTTIAPDQDSLAAMGASLMDPRPRAEVIGAGLAQGRRIAQTQGTGVA
jgi:NTE family protein